MRTIIQQHYDRVIKRRIEFAFGKIDDKTALFVLVPNETRPPGRHQIKSGPGSLLECSDIISLDVLGRKIKMVSGCSSRCRGYMFDFPFLARPYLHFSVPIRVCRQCRYYRKRNKIRYNYPICGAVNRG